MKPLASSSLALLLALGLGSVAHAVTTERFAVETASDFLAGTLDGTAVLSSGLVTKSASLERIAIPDATLAWSFARATDGTLFVGTGSDGVVYRVQGNTATRFATTGQLVVSALAFGPDGTLYAGTLPEGRIFAIDRQGQSRELARPERAEHVWSLVWDARRGRLFAGTGPEGKVFAIDAQGHADVFYDGDDDHVLSLALAEDGTLYAGTSDRALVLRLLAPGRAEVVGDFPGTEVTAIAVRNGVLAVAANEFTGAPAGPPPQGWRQSPPGARVRPRAGKGKLFRVDREGRTERVFAEDDGHFTAVQVGDDGTIWAGGGKDGRVYRIGPDRASATWLDVDERQVLALDLTSNDPVLLTGDGAAVYRVRRTPPERPTWTSAALDAGTRAEFGTVVVRGSEGLEVETRSGNTEAPDATWSPWASSGRGALRVASPPGRYLQVRVRFPAAADASLRGVLAYYLPTNQRPVVLSVGTTVDAAQATARRRGRQAASSIVKLTWRVDNPDNDEVRYRLRFRREGETLFRDVLRPDVVHTATTYDWDTTGVPDGLYVVEVEASDELSNASPRVLTSSAVSAPLLVDNHAPVFTELAARGATVRGRVVDAVGPVSRIEVAIDGAPFRDVDPADGLLDQSTEDLEFTPVTLSSGSHLVAVRATDAAGHQVVGEVTVDVTTPRTR